MHLSVEPEQIPLFDGGPDMARLRADALRMVARSSQAENTRSAYASDWKDFAAWCRSTGRSALPASADTLTLFVMDRLKTRKVSTVERRLAAIVSRHERDGRPSPYTPQLRALMSAARREKGVSVEQKAALSASSLKRILRWYGARRSFAAVRDRALIALGFGGGMRRSELAALDVADLVFHRKGVQVTVRRGKTDQEARGRVLGIFKASRSTHCPVASVKAWLALRGSEDGPLFPGSGKSGRLTGQAINDVVKRACQRVGLDSRLYGAHSLRAGFVTAAIQKGVPESIIMQRTGHRSIATVAKYVRPASVFSVDALARAL
jgi:integrase